MIRFIITVLFGWLTAFLLGLTPINEMVQHTFNCDYTAYTVATMITFVVGSILRGIVVVERD